MTREETAYGPLNHPQRHEGEVYMGRCWSRWNSEADRARGFEGGWKTARVGELEPWRPATEFPAAARKHPMGDSLPWFVSAGELADAGVWDPVAGRFLGEWAEPGYYDDQMA